MKIAITGATGFIGEMLTKKHLSLGDEVHVLTRKKSPNFEFSNKVIIHIGDLSDLDSLQDFIKDIDVLYHCAAEVWDEANMYTTNVQGTKNLIKASSKELIHWVQLSSVGVYGPIQTGNITENQPYNPMNEYERTKLKSDLAVIEASKKNSFTFTVVRPSNVFGANMKNNALFQLINSIDKGVHFFIGTKGASANYVSIDNVVHALILAATSPNAKNQIYTISHWMTIEDFIEIISKALGRRTPKFRVPLSLIKFIAKCTSFFPSNPLTIGRVNALSNKAIYVTSKIEKELDYKSVIPIEVTLKELVKKYKQ